MVVSQPVIYSVGQKT